VTFTLVDAAAESIPEVEQQTWPPAPVGEVADQWDAGGQGGEQQPGGADAWGGLSSGETDGATTIAFSSLSLAGKILGGLAVLLAVAGIAMQTLGSVWLLIAMFKENIWWGIGALFCCFAMLVFAVMNWSDSKKPVLLWLAGFVVNIVGMGLLFLVTIVG